MSSLVIVTNGLARRLSSACARLLRDRLPKEIKSAINFYREREREFVTSVVKEAPSLHTMAT